MHKRTNMHLDACAPSAHNRYVPLYMMGSISFCPNSLVDTMDSVNLTAIWGYHYPTACFCDGSLCKTHSCHMWVYYILGYSSLFWRHSDIFWTTNLSPVTWYVLPLTMFLSITQAPFSVRWNMWQDNCNKEFDTGESVKLICLEAVAFYTLFYSRTIIHTHTHSLSLYAYTNTFTSRYVHGVQWTLPEAARKHVTQIPAVTFNLRRTSLSLCDLCVVTCLLIRSSFVFKLILWNKSFDFYLACASHQTQVTKSKDFTFSLSFLGSFFSFPWWGIEGSAVTHMLTSVNA